MEYKVLITTSGTGSRLGELTKNTNKALVPLNGKATISYIIEAYPVETPFVITIGYFGDQVRDFLLQTYPDRTFEFVTVDVYQGDGSSLGYSMLKARDVLQCPFIFHCNDTIVSGEIIPPTQNWIGVIAGEDATQYSTWKITEDGQPVFQNKGAITFDYIHIGLIGIQEYARYFETLERLYHANPNDQSLNDCKVLMDMIVAGSKFKFHTFDAWYDTGNIPALEHAKLHFGK